MKRFKSKLSIVLTLVMIITSFGFIGVFAEDQVPGASNDQIDATNSSDTPVAPVVSGNSETDQDINGSENGTDPNPADPQDPVEPEVPAIEAPVVYSYSGCNSVILLWEKSEDPSIEYEVTINNPALTGSLSTFKPVSDYFPSKDEMWMYTISNLSEGQGVSGTVKAVSGDSESAPTKFSNAAVQTIRYKVKVKKSGTLKSHGGPSRSYYVKKGQYLYCYGFGGGKYIFKVGDSIFYCNKTRTSKRSCVYTNAWNYSKGSAEFFINAKNLSSNTGSLIWVNTYTQHLYRFIRKEGRWIVAKDFDCSTGKASTPSPTGISGQKTIWKKISKRHGIKYWSPYSDINSIHAKKKKWGIGRPSSNGCIRNYESNAYDIYVNAKIGTKVYLY